LASDKLFFSLFQDSPDLVLRWLHDLPPDAGGYRFSAPVLKEREYRLDGLFSPPEQRNDLPAVILEAQMAADPEFLLRLYAESARFLQQERWPRDWRVVVICPHRQLNFGPLTPAQPAAAAGTQAARHLQQPASASRQRPAGGRSTAVDPGYPAVKVQRQTHPGDLCHGRLHG